MEQWVSPELEPQRQWLNSEFSRTTRGKIQRQWPKYRVSIVSLVELLQLHCNLTDTSTVCYRRLLCAWNIRGPCNAIDNRRNDRELRTMLRMTLYSLHAYSERFQASAPYNTTPYASNRVCRALLNCEIVRGFDVSSKKKAMTDSYVRCP